MFDNSGISIDGTFMWMLTNSRTNLPNMVAMVAKHAKPNLIPQLHFNEYLPLNNECMELLLCKYGFLFNE